MNNKLYDCTTVKAEFQTAKYQYQFDFGYEGTPTNSNDNQQKQETPKPIKSQQCQLLCSSILNPEQLPLSPKSTQLPKELTINLHSESSMSYESNFYNEQTNMVKKPETITKIYQNLQSEFQNKYHQTLQNAANEIDRLASLLKQQKLQVNKLTQIIEERKIQQKSNDRKYSDVIKRNQELQQKLVDKDNVIRVLIEANPQSDTKAIPPIEPERQIQLLKLLEGEKQLNKEKDKKIEELLDRIITIQKLLEQLSDSNSGIIYEVSQILQASQNSIRKSQSKDEMEKKSKVNQQKAGSDSKLSDQQRREEFRIQLRQLKDGLLNRQSQESSKVSNKVQILQRQVKIMLEVYERICKSVY